MFGGLRISEVTDLKFENVAEKEDLLEITIKRSKLTRMLLDLFFLSLNLPILLFALFSTILVIKLL